MAIDLEQFHQVFFEESLEGLDIMEQTLLSISSNGADTESINTIFRAAHSIKGGSGTFGFMDITNFTHAMETLLDEARDGQRQLTEELIELLLSSSDCLRQMITTLQAGDTIDTNQMQPLLDQFNALLTGAATTSNTDTPDQSQTAEADMEATEESPRAHWRIEFSPEPQVLMTGNEPLRIFRELAELGKLQVTAHTSQVPDFHLLTPDECYISWSLDLYADTNKDDIAEAFDWVIDECKLTITPASELDSVEPAEADDQAQITDVPAQPATVAEQIPAPVATPTPKTEPQEPAAVDVPVVPTETKVAPTTKADTPASAPPASTSIRVGIDKVDSLINLVGELVITQSMLSELGTDFDMSKLEKLGTGLEQLLQNTKELQESVMRIRMLPISFAFNRFPRMIRDLASKTGKQVDLQIQGENTELDKTVMEQIGDPLVHLVRNAIDHGIETAEARKAAGKPEMGTINLDAYHQGGNIVVEVKDDGGGIDRQIILNKAIEKGLVEGDGRDMSDEQVFDLIFEPGFSTAVEVSDISGRGVGMDVVKRNIKSLGGRIHIESTLGEGSVFRVHLPLTLAILDGQLIRVGQETYVIPLIAIVESLQIKPEHVNRVAGDMILYRLREDNVPIVPIHRLFNIQADSIDLDNALMVVVEAEGEKIGLLVDDLLAQQQVVIKSLQDNYQQVGGISGATILGDGSVAMILDVGGLLEFAFKQINRKKTRAA